MKQSVSAIFAVTLLLAGCGNPPQRAQVAPLSGPPAAVRVQSVALAAPPEPCTGVFAAHDLDHTTATPRPVARMFEGNGAGVAIGDLDDDGRDGDDAVVEIVFGLVKHQRPLGFQQKQVEQRRRFLAGG